MLAVRLAVREGRTVVGHPTGDLRLNHQENPSRLFGGRLTWFDEIRRLRRYAI